MERDRQLSSPTAWAFALLMLAAAVLFITHAWVVDDAYITFRTVDNFVHGYGLRWNIDERVQAYTHPLWMFLVCAFYLVTREPFYTSLALSFVLTAAALGVVAHALDRHRPSYAKLLSVGLLLASKAFQDFSSSGLENPLTHLLLALFITRLLFPTRPWSEASPRELFWFFLLATLGFLNRADSVLLFAPGALHVLASQPKGRRRAAFLALGWALVPAVAWVLFSLFYYGIAVPNTALAKLTGPRLDALERLRAGVAYFLDSLFLDFATLPLCAFAAFVALRSRDRALWSVTSGMVLYLIYVLVAGAVGTHMSGRFFSAPAFIAAIVIAIEASSWAHAASAGAFAALVLAISPFSPLKVGTSAYATEQTGRRAGVLIDTRAYVLREGAALLDYSHDISLPNHGAYFAGLQLRGSSERVVEGGPGNGYSLMIGYSGFAAGPDKHIVDVLGLTDPLIARLPLAKGAAWRPGHFFRAVPKGYVESLRRSQNLIEDPNLHGYYELVREVTCGPLFSWPRIKAIWRLNTSTGNELLRAYSETAGLRW